MFLDYGLKDMCTNRVTTGNINVGNAALSKSQPEWNSDNCEEITLASAGECISEITFYRDD